MVGTFCAKYAAKAFIDAALQHGGFKWRPADKRFSTIPDTIVGDNNVEIRVPGGNSLEELMEYEPTGAELEWELPEQLARQCTLVRRAYDPSEDVQVDEDTGEVVKPTKKEKPPKEPKPEKPKKDKTGLVTVGEIAEQMGIDAKDARSSLRKQKVEKPDVGWAWPPEKVEEIKKTIKAGLK